MQPPRSACHAARPTIVYVDPHDAARACMWQALPAARVLAARTLEAAGRLALGTPTDDAPQGPGADLVLVRAATCGEGVYRWAQGLDSRGFSGTCCLLFDRDDEIEARARATGLATLAFPLPGFMLRAFVYGQLGLAHDGAKQGGYDPGKASEEHRGESWRPRIDADDEDVLLLALGHRSLTPEDVRLVTFASHTTTQRELAERLGLAHESAKSAAKRVQLKTGMNVHALAHGIARDARRRARDAVAFLMAPSAKASLMAERAREDEGSGTHTLLVDPSATITAARRRRDG